MLVETFDTQGSSGLYTIRCYLLDHMLENVQRFRTVSVDTAADMSILFSSSSSHIEIVRRGHQ